MIEKQSIAAVDEQEPTSTSKRFLVVLVLFLLAVILAAILPFTPSPVVADSSKANEDAFIFLPVTMDDYSDAEIPAEGIAGVVYATGKPAPDIRVALRQFNGTKWSIVDATMSDSSGKYHFSDVDSLAAGEEYYVSYGRNESNSDYVYFWYGPIIDSFTAGDVIFAINFDISNVFLRYPKSGLKLTLPITFTWDKRGLEGDTYRLVIIDLDNDVFWRTFDLGDVDSFTMENLAPGMEFDKKYAWYIEVYMGPDSFGESYGINDIRFLPTSTPQQPTVRFDHAFAHGSGRGGR